MDCLLLLIGSCDFPLGKPAPHWALTLTNTKKTRNNSFHIRLLTGCDGLEADASRFRQRRNKRSPNDPSCKLCEAPLEDSLQFAPRECRAALQLIKAVPSMSECKQALYSLIPRLYSPAFVLSGE
jgi:hypothetical protein